ncbi:MAG: DUF4625 domain-containing protein [Rikenellaceae bacterium]|nr:DUF4625 domain-containing protein [Rikenellaceae bacterium]
MKTIGLTSTVLFSFCWLLTACSDNEGDTTPPRIDLIAPVEGAVLTIGDPHGVLFEADFSNDVMLGSYKIEIHANFDGHDHSRSGEPDAETVDFYFQRSYDLSGLRHKENEHHHDIVIPENATPGNYHLMVWCTDQAGNESSVARNIRLSLEEGEDHEHQED